MRSTTGQGVDLTRAQWRATRRSQANGACVEVADGFPDVVPVRDSKNPGAALLIPGRAWASFVTGLKRDTF
jgi:hypothetical protein